MCEPVLTRYQSITNTNFIQNTGEVIVPKTYSPQINPKQQQIGNNLTLPDSKRGWVCVFSYFVASFVILGVISTFGIIYNDFKDAFPEAKHIQIATVPSLAGTSILAFGVISTALASAFSTRRIVFLGGLMVGTGYCLASFSRNILFIQCLFLMAGVGSSLTLIPGFVIIPKHFRKRQSLAVGLGVAGGAIGTMVFQPLTRFLADYYGFRGALLIQGGLLYNTCVVALLYSEPTPPKKNTEDDTVFQNRSNARFQWIEKHLYVDLNLLRNPMFICILFATIFANISYPHIYTFLPPHAQSLGYSVHMAGLLISISSVGNAMGRLISGWFFDKGFVTKHTGCTICGLVMSVSLIGIGIFPNYYLLSTLSLLYGYFFGTYLVSATGVLADEFGAHKLSSSLGITLSCVGILGYIVPTIAGHIRDVTGSFQYSLIMFGCLTLLSPVFLLPVLVIKKLSNK